MPYSESNRKLVQAFTLQKPNWVKSYPDYYTFDEDEVNIKNVAVNLSSCLVFDIKRYSFITQKSMDFGFAVYPLVSDFQNRLYMNSGVMQLTMYEGKVPINFIALLSKDPLVPVQETITSFVKSGEFKQLNEPISVVVRVVDN
jgi:hypothetical protein